MTAVDFSISLCLYSAMSAELVLVECLMHEWTVEGLEVLLIYHQQQKENCWYVRIVWAHPALNKCNGPIWAVRRQRKRRVGPRLEESRGWAETNTPHPTYNES